MQNPIQKITIDGKEVHLLFTPSMWKVAVEKGISIDFLHVSEYVHITWLKIIHLAHLNYNATQRYDNPSIELEDLKFMPFELWAVQNREDFTKMLTIAIELMTGKSVAELNKQSAEEKKKREKSLPRRSIWHRIMKI